MDRRSLLLEVARETRWSYALTVLHRLYNNISLHNTNAQINWKHIVVGGGSGRWMWLVDLKSESRRKLILIHGNFLVQCTKQVGGDSRFAVGVGDWGGVEWTISLSTKSFNFFKILYCTPSLYQLVNRTNNLEIFQHSYMIFTCLYLRDWREDRRELHRSSHTYVIYTLLY